VVRAAESGKMFMQSAASQGQRDTQKRLDPGVKKTRRWIMGLILGYTIVSWQSEQISKRIHTVGYRKYFRFISDHISSIPFTIFLNHKIQKWLLSEYLSNRWRRWVIVDLAISYFCGQLPDYLYTNWICSCTSLKIQFLVTILSYEMIFGLINNPLQVTL